MKMLEHLLYPVHEAVAFVPQNGAFRFVAEPYPIAIDSPVARSIQFPQPQVRD